MSAELPATVPGPVPPDDRAAWYAPAVRAQYHVGAGVVATVAETDEGYRYRTREPNLRECEVDATERVETAIDDEVLTRPRTREEAIERVSEGLPGGWQLPPVPGSRSPGARRRLDYHLTASLRGLGELTPLALDDRIRIADTSGDQLAVHTQTFAPVVTDLDTDTAHLERFLSERLAQTTVEYQGFDVPAVVYRRQVLGADTYHTRYAVGEPPRHPGDEEHLEAVTNRLVEAPPPSVRADRTAAVLERARTLLDRRLRRPSLGSLVEPVRRALATLSGSARSLASQQQPTQRSERLDDLAYHVTRDLVGDGALTIPLRDPRIRSIEVPGIGEPVSVVPHPGVDIDESRLPTSLAIESPAAFRRVARSLAAEGGVELSSDRPVATVEIERPVTAAGHDTSSQRGDPPTRTLECSIALPDADGTGAHISITASRASPPSPIGLIDRGVLTPELVAAVWTLLAEAGTVVFVGPARAEPIAALAAHVPFVSPAVRPVSLPGTDRAVPVPHETGVTIGSDALSTEPWPALGDRAGLDPGLVILAGIEAPDPMRRFGAALAAGRGSLAAARTADRGFLEEAARDAGLSPRAIGGIDLVVELTPRDDAEQATAWIPVADAAEDRTEPEDSPTGAATATGQRFEQVDWVRAFGSTRGRGDGDPEGLERVAARTNHVDPADLERRRQYVEFLQAESMTDRSALLSFLADLRTDEAATMERIRGTLE